MTRLSLRLLGAPEVHIQGAPLDLNHQKARALLYYLAATDQPHTRPHLTALLWSEAPEADARHSLRSCLYRLRQALRPGQAHETLVVAGDLLSLRLDPERDACDVRRFRWLAGEARAPAGESALEEAVALYRGAFLQGFSVGGAPLFDEWLQAEDARLGHAYQADLERLAAQAEARQDWQAVLGFAQRQVQFDPLGDEAQRRLIEAQLRQGAAGQALRQYQHYEARLRQDLGTEPSARVRALLREALSHPAPALSGTPSPRLQLHALPLVGRDALIAQLLDASRALLDGRSAALLLQGEGGIGKTRLLDELAGRLSIEAPSHQRWIVLRGTCSPFDHLLSYGPFLEALQDFGAAGLEEPQAEAGSTAPDARGQFFWRVLQTLRSLARGGPVLLAIDDLQWANSSTLNLFGFLATRLRGLPVLLVGTVQRAEAVPALQRLLTLGRRRGELRLFSLAPLTLEAVAALLRGTGVAPDSAPGLAEWLHERSGGSPFLLREILAQLRADLILQPTGPGWRLDAARWLRWRTAFTLPETTYDLVSWRLANLAPEARQVLDVLAVAGQPLPTPLLRELLDYRDDQLLPLADDLIARGLVVEAPGGRLALPHHLLRETLLHQQSQLRRHALHRRLAEKLEASAALAPDIPLRQIALHAVLGEDLERARRHGLRVLADLPQHYTGAETAEFLRHLYDLLAPTSPAADLLPLTRALGQAHQAVGQLDLAARWLQTSLDLARQTGDVPAEAAAQFELSELALVRNNHQAAAHAAEAGLALLGHAAEPAGLEPAIARGHRLVGAALAMEGRDLPAAEQHLQAAAAAHRRMGTPSDLSAALFELGNVAAQRGQVASALDFYAQAATAAEAGRAHYYHALAHNNYAYHSLLLGQPAAARQAVALGLKLAETYEMLGVLLFLYSTQGEVHLYLGEWAAATQAFERGLGVAEDLGNLERQAGYRAGLALAARGQGHDLASATLLLEEALALIGGQGYVHLQTRLLLWLAETLTAAGRDAQAWRHLEAALATAVAHGRTLLVVQGQRLRARLLAQGGDWPAARALFAETLERAAGLGLPLEVARTQAEWGAAALRAGLAADEGRSLLAQARATLEACDARAELAALARPAA